MNHPVGRTGFFTKGRESQQGLPGVIVQRTCGDRLLKGSSERSQKGFPEADAEQTHWRKEGRFADSDPARAIQGDSSALDDAMEVRM